MMHAIEAFAIANEKRQARHRYGVNSVFGPTIQGEGPEAGVVCIFVRFSGCNMWDGRPETKAESNCPYCDTDFFSHDMLTCDAIMDRIKALDNGVEWIWLSGGEPLLQVDEWLIRRLHREGYKVAVETNGTVKPRPGVKVDLLTVSPKLPPQFLKIKKADSLKVLYPHPNPSIHPSAFDELKASWRYVQPVEIEDDPDATKRNIDATVQFALAHPAWRVGIQMHKMIGVA